MDPCYILPKEMWEEILERLEDPQDKLNLVSSHSWLECVFYSNISTWQFLAILPLVADHADRTDDFNLNLAILSCRMLSSECCKTIDKYIDRHWEESCSYPSFTGNDWYFIWDLNDAGDMLKEMKGHPPNRSPVLSKFLRSWWPCPRDIDHELSLEMKNLVAEVGHHLKGVHWEIGGVNSTEIGDSCLFLRNLLALTPNIHLLELHFPPYDYEEIADEDTDIIPPNLPNLRNLIITSCLQSAKTVGLMIKLNSYFPQLVYLRLKFSYWKEPYNVGSQLPNLKCLHMDSIIISETQEQEKAYKFLDSLDTPQLEELRLDLETQWRRLLTSGFENYVYFLKMLALFTLKRSGNEKEWIVREIKNEMGAVAKIKFGAVIIK